ncbi:MAG: DNA polymerase III subunit delta' [Thermomicrobiaceae bacterium]
MEAAEIPSGIWPVVGHQNAVDQLARAVSSGRINHAYLFTGPDGIGRRTLAKTFAQALVCQVAPEARPCGECSACRRVQDGTFPDVTTLSLETQLASSERRDSRNTVISIETIRELRSSVSLRPMEANWRVAIVEDVERVSRDAYDALLKTLEEPPSYVVLLLIATEFAALPETIRSRCRQISLEPVPGDLVAEELIRRGAEDEQARLIARLTRGRIARAFDLMDDPETLEQRRSSVDSALEMIEDPLAALAEARRMADLYRRGQRDQVQQEVDQLIGLWRDLLLHSAGRPDDVTNIDVIERLTATGRSWSLIEIQAAVESCYQALHDLSVNVQPRLALNTMVVQWPEPR